MRYAQAVFTEHVRYFVLAVPPNGLLVYCGTILTEDGKERKVNIDFEPFRPINTSLYLCDNKFHTEALSALLTDDSRFGFLVMDGSGALFGVVSGNTREIITKYSVDLPKKHGKYTRTDAARISRSLTTLLGLAISLLCAFVYLELTI